MNSFLDNAIETLKKFFGDALFNIFSGLIAIVIGFFVVKIIKSIIRKLLFRLPINDTVSTFTMSILTAIIYVIYILIVASSFGIPMTGFIALISSIGVAVGLALKDSLSNIANGILLVTMKPFNVGDYVVINNQEGTIIGIHLVSTEIQTVDNKIITVPNNQVLNNNIVNFNGMSTRRLDMIITVAYGSDIEKVKALLLKMANSHEKVLKNPEPTCRLSELADSSLNFSLKMWVKSEDYWNTKFDFNENVIKIFEEEGIEIPYNKLDINIKEIPNRSESD